ncbi:MAG: hypothetical protein EXR07_10315 [Acetobacteraceae bacterium]|nr:hypothetical protein [Acetobacteraceae bacterium]
MDGRPGHRARNPGGSARIPGRNVTPDGERPRPWRIVAARHRVLRLSRSWPSLVADQAPQTPLSPTAPRRRGRVARRTHRFPRSAIGLRLRPRPHSARGIPILAAGGIAPPSGCGGIGRGVTFRPGIGRNNAARRVVRGGSWNNEARNARAACRNQNDPANRNNDVGFRCARSSRVDGFPPVARLTPRAFRVRNRFAETRRKPVCW